LEIESIVPSVQRSIPTFRITNKLDVLEDKGAGGTYSSQLGLGATFFPYINSARRNHTSFFCIKSSRNHWEDAKEDGMEYNTSI